MTVGFSDRVTRLFSNDRALLGAGRNLGLLGLDLLPPASAGSPARPWASARGRCSAMPVWSRARKARLLRFAMNLYPPFLGRASVRHIAGDFREVRVRMGLNRLNRNYVGTQFGGSLYAMTDPFFMLMLMENLGRDYVVWDKAANIEFVSPGRPGACAFQHRPEAARRGPRADRRRREVPAPAARRSARRRRHPGGAGSENPVRAAQAAPAERGLKRAHEWRTRICTRIWSSSAPAWSVAPWPWPWRAAAWRCCWWTAARSTWRRSPEAPYEPRVSALSEASRRILQRLHAWDGIVARRAEPLSRDAGVGWLRHRADRLQRRQRARRGARPYRREPGGAGRPCWSACTIPPPACWPTRAWNRCATPVTTGC